MSTVKGRGKGSYGTSNILINPRAEDLKRKKLEETPSPCSECMFYKFSSFDCKRDKRSKEKSPKKCKKFMFKSNTNYI